MTSHEETHAIDSNRTLSPKISSLKQFWQKNEGLSHTPPPVKSKNRASLIMLSGMAGQSETSVKNRIETWSHATQQSPQPASTERPKVDGVKPPPVNIKSRIEAWKDITSNQPATKQPPAREVDLPERAADVKERIETWKQVAVVDKPVMEPTESKPKDTELRSVEIDLKTRIEQYKASATQAPPPSKKADPREEIKQIAAMEKPMMPQSPPAATKKIDPRAEIRMVAAKEKPMTPTTPPPESKKIDPREEIRMVAEMEKPMMPQSPPAESKKIDPREEIRMVAEMEKPMMPESPTIDSREEIRMMAEMENHSLAGTPVPTVEITTTECSPCPVEEDVEHRMASPTAESPVSITSECSKSPEHGVFEVEGTVPTGTKSLTALCLYDYVATEDDELSFSAGDIVYNINQLDEGWWLGMTADGHHGLFPANYVEPNN